MNRRMRHAVLAASLALLLVPALVSAEVSRVEITARRDVAGGRSFGSAGPHEQIVGKLYFAFDPANKRNRVVADLDKAPRNAAGKIEMSADLVILRPRDSSKANGIALFDIVNRGRGVALAKFDTPVSVTGAAAPDEHGDGFLLNRGYTIVQVGWEFDAVREGAIRADLPAAAGVTGLAHATFIPTSNSAEATVGDLVGYMPGSPAAPQNTLTVRDSPQAAATTIPRAKWRLAGNVVTLDGGFEPGRIYEVGTRRQTHPSRRWVSPRSETRHRGSAVRPTRPCRQNTRSRSARRRRALPSRIPTTVSTPTSAIARCSTPSFRTWRVRRVST